MKPTEEQIKSIVASLLTEGEEFLVSVKVSPRNEIRVRVDAYHGLSIDRCVALSRAIEVLLNRDEEDFSLEVSSAGLDMPYVVPEQYRKHVGDPITVLLKTGERLDGVLVRVEDEGKFVVGLPTKGKRGTSKKSTEATAEPSNERVISSEEVKEACYRF